MDNNFIIAQIFGVIALIFLGLSFRINRKKNILKYQNFANLAYSLQYITLGAYSGLLMYLMCIVRNFWYSRYKNGEVPKIVLIIILIIMLGLSILSYNKIYSLIPIFGIGINTYGLWQKKLKVTRRCQLIAASSVTIYNLIVSAYAGAIATFIEVILTLVAIYRFDIKKRKNVV